ncbi:hypothetical protein EB796_007634 [Bugula neritina]|uniref:Uncharacterized protein n=1 Tax=Bugula neritina TaxID=10212 RepID=A0A7J7K7Z9_BUGNE|nr:hypothetical protein EB796_007634 [Bugula neritina]
MASKEFKDPQKLLCASGTKPKRSKVSSQPPTASTSKAPTAPHTSPGPKAEAKAKALVREEDQKSKAAREPIAKMDVRGFSAATVHKVTTKRGSGHSSAGTSIGTAGSLMGLDCEEPMDASDITLPNAYEEKRLFFRVYSNETLRPSYTAHNLVESLIGGVNVNLPAPLMKKHKKNRTNRNHARCHCFSKKWHASFHYCHSLLCAAHTRDSFTQGFARLPGIEEFHKYFNKHWKARLEGISYVSISKNIWLRKETGSVSTISAIALIKDRYRLSKDPISLCQTECNEELMEAETHKLLMFANSLRDDYIIKRYADLQNNMYFPVESAAVWMKLMVKLANSSATEQKSCLVDLHRQSLKDGKSNGKAAFTLQPQAEPVAFHFEKYSNPEVSFEVESSADGLQELICDLDKTSYMCARCLADREDEGKVTLIEVACIPKYILNMIQYGRYKSKFIEKSFRANVDSR